VTLGGNKDIDAFIWDGTQWTDEDDINKNDAFSGVYKCVDIEYEPKDKTPMILWSDGTTSPAGQPAFSTYSSGTWTKRSATTSISSVDWIEMARDTYPSTSNEIAAVAITDTPTIEALVWDGTDTDNSWTVTQMASTAYTKDQLCADIEYETDSGEALCVYSDGSSGDLYYRTYTSSGWSTGNPVYSSGNPSGVRWVRMSRDPVSDEITVITLDNTYVYVHEWDGSAWRTSGFPAQLSSDHYGTNTCHIAIAQHRIPEYPTELVPIGIVVLITIIFWSVKRLKLKQIKIEKKEMYRRRCVRDDCK
jgi:hypothetical protein